MSNTIININGVIGVNTTFAAIKDKIDNAQGDTIEVHIMSPGGSVDEGFGIYSALKSSDKKIVTKGMGTVASIATVIFMAGDERFLDENVDFMIHNSAIMMDPMKAHEAKDLESMAEGARKIENKLTTFYANSLNKSFGVIDELMDKETHFTAEEAFNFGFSTARSIKSETTNNHKLKAVAFYNPNSDMFKNLFRAQATNLLIETDGGIKLVSDAESNETLEGSSVWIADENGEKTDEQPDSGDHTLSDGTKITVEDGKVSSVNSGEEATAVEEVEEEIEEEDKFAAFEEKINAKIDEKFDALTTQVTNLSTAMGDQVDQQNTDLDGVMTNMKREITLAVKGSIEGTTPSFDGNESSTAKNAVYRPSSIALKMKQKEEERTKQLDK